MPGRRRSQSMGLKREVVADYNAGEALQGLSKRHDIRHNPIRVRNAKPDADKFDDGEALEAAARWMIVGPNAAAGLLTVDEARTAAL